MDMIARRRFVNLALASGAALAAGPRAFAQSRPKIKVGSLTLPVFAPILANVMKAKGFDTKAGFDLEITAYPSIAAYYAGLATGEIDTLIGGPTYFQKLRLENVPIKIIATGAKLSDLVIIAKDPAIKSLADLKGKQLAADMGSGQFQVLSIYAKSKGIDLAKDIQLISANFAVARAQLAADRVEAAMIIEPIATMMMKENPALKIVFNANDAWKEMTGKEGWELVYAMREDTLRRNPDAAKMFIAALADVATFIRSNPDEADKIAADTVKLPPGILKAAVESKRWDFEALPAWQNERASLWDMFERAVAAGFHPKLPDEGIIYVP
ncbi:MAG: ABC transporter substrate-binding protein [Thermoleophilaceae bacterium]|nr:ABC transporter substrate-binding protein [Thermoleophilaceae bacterium]